MAQSLKSPIYYYCFRELLSIRDFFNYFSVQCSQEKMFVFVKYYKKTKITAFEIDKNEHFVYC